MFQIYLLKILVCALEHLVATSALPGLISLVEFDKLEEFCLWHPALGHSTTGWYFWHFASESYHAINSKFSLFFSTYYFHKPAKFDGIQLRSGLGLTARKETMKKKNLWCFVGFFCFVLLGCLGGGRGGVRYMCLFKENIMSSETPFLNSSVTLREKMLPISFFFFRLDTLSLTVAV